MDGVEWEGGAAESDCRDLNCASLRLMVAASIAHMIEKWSLFNTYATYVHFYGP